MNDLICASNEKGAHHICSKSKGMLFCPNCKAIWYNKGEWDYNERMYGEVKRIRAIPGDALHPELFSNQV